MIVFFQWSLAVWALLKIVDLLIEVTPAFGGDGVQIYDAAYWLCRPFSFRGFYLFTVPILIGILMWIALIIGSAWAVYSLIATL